MLIATFCLVLVELGLRCILGLGRPVLYVAESSFGYFPKASQKLHRFFVDISINALGMRSEPIGEKKKPGEYRILFVGDSVLFGTSYVDQNEIMSALIASNFHRTNPNITVLNASAPGWAPDNEFGYIRTRGTYDADLIVMVYNTKDLNQPFAQYMPTPLLPLENPDTAIGELWTHYLQPRLLHKNKFVDPSSTSTDSPPSSSDASSFLKSAEETQSFIQSQQARMAILYVPSETNDVRQNQVSWDAAFQQLKDWGKQKSVPVIDLTSTFARIDPQLIYFDGIHLRPYGNRLVSDAFTAWFEDYRGAKQ